MIKNSEQKYDHDDLIVKVFSATVLIYIGAPLFGETTAYIGNGKTNASLPSSLTAMAFISLIYLWYLKTRNLKFAIRLTSVIQLIFYSYGLYVSGGIRAEHFFYLSFFPVINGFLLGRNAAILTTVICILLTWFFASLEHFSLIPIENHSFLITATQATFCLFFIGGLVWLFESERLKVQKKLLSTLYNLNQSNSQAQQNELFLAESQEISKVGNWRLNLETFEQTWSSQHYKIFEIDEPQPQLSLHRLYRDRIHPDDIAELDRVFKTAIDQGSDFTFNHRIYLENGSRIKYVQGVGKVTRDRNGKPIFFAGTCQDRTTEVEQEIKFRKIIESMSEGVALINETGKIIDTNSAVTEILGISKSDLTDMRSIHAKICPFLENGEAVNFTDMPCELALRAKLPFSGITIGFLHPRNGVKWIRISAKLSEFYFGKGAIITFTDLSDLIKTGTDIKNIFKYSNDLIGMLDKGGNLHYVNPAFANTLNWKSNEITSWRFLELIHPDDLETVKTKLSQVSIEHPSQFDARILAKNGEHRTVNWIVSTNPNFNALYITGRDLTEQLALKGRLEIERSKSIHATKLASLGEMAAGISHEINNPLTVITSTIRSILKYKDGTDLVVEKLLAAQTAAAKIEKISNGLRKFSRSTNGSHYKMEDIKEILDEVLLLTGARARKQLVPITVVINTSTPLYCDSVELEQVLVNLINNSVDAIQNQTEKWIKITATENSLGMSIQVTDSGTGISEETEQKIFQPFYTTKPPGQSTGLGLSISKGLVEHAGGSLKVNRDSSNTCFEVFFPNSIERRTAQKEEILEIRPTPALAKR